MAVVLVVFLVCGPAGAQGVVGDLLAGKLIKPKVGQWAWYNLVDSRAKRRYVVRQAIVGEEKVGKKDGYWVEIELIPEVGYKVIYRMLLTGPASDPKNIHRVIRKNGPDPAEEVPVAVEEAEEEEEEERRRQERTSAGKENVHTGSGIIEAEHFVVMEGEHRIDLWINEEVLPSGIVRMRSMGGEMVLRNHGVSGKFGQSAITETPIMQGPGDESPEAAEPQPEE